MIDQNQNPDQINEENQILKMGHRADHRSLRQKRYLQMRDWWEISGVKIIDWNGWHGSLAWIFRFFDEPNIETKETENEMGDETQASDLGCQYNLNA